MSFNYASTQILFLLDDGAGHRYQAECSPLSSSPVPVDPNSPWQKIEETTGHLTGWWVEEQEGVGSADYPWRSSDSQSALQIQSYPEYAEQHMLTPILKKKKEEKKPIKLEFSVFLVSITI